MDEWEQEHVFDAEFAAAAHISRQRAGEIRAAYEAAWNTLNEGPLQPVTPEEQQSFAAFHSATKQTYAALIPGEMVRECVDQIQAGLIDPAALSGATHLLVDEFQDLNECDQTFIEKFAARRVTLFLAGDDDQSIYSFRHAAPHGIVNIPQRYPGASTHILPDCFRCPPSIIGAGLGFVARNQVRVPKQITSVYAGRVPPLMGRLEAWRFADGLAEAAALAESCRELIRSGVSPAQILILVASRDTQSPLIEEALARVDVPFSSPRGRGLKMSMPGRAVLALVRIIASDEDYVAYRDLLGCRYHVGPAAALRIKTACTLNNLNFRDLFAQQIPAGIFNAVDTATLTGITGVRAVARGWALQDTVGNRDAGFQELLAMALGPGTRPAGEAIALWRDEIASILGSDATLDEALSFVGADNEAEQQVVLDALQNRLSVTAPARARPRVRIMTYHSAKGLGAAVVFAPGLEVGLMPSRQALQSPGLFEERRRLLYVGITRARVACFISLAITRIGAQAQRLGSRWQLRMPPSPFLGELGLGALPRPGGLTPAEAAAVAADIASL
jgi:superfamily I DNA/RNA helicase